MGWVNKSPVVRLHISLTGDVDHPQEVIRKVTEDFEEVEVDGFVFKRKRQIAEQQSSRQPADEYQQTEQSQIANVHQSACIPERHAHLIPVDAATLEIKAEALLKTIEADNDIPQVLPGFCERLAESALQEAAIPEGVKQRLAATWPADVAMAVRQALANGTLICDRPDKPDSREHATDIEKENRRIRLAYLQTRVQTLEREKEEWQRLAEEHHQMAEELGLTPADAASPQDRMAPDAAEEALALSQDLSSARQDAHRQICLQVEGLSALVEGVEELVGRAERQCGLLQAHWHRDKFRKFPHVDSPARLIRDIIQPVPPT
eukprot:jgi/Botrbrau1/8671/Bobra.0087s0024.1